MWEPGMAGPAEGIQFTGPLEAQPRWDFDFFERTCGDIKVEVTLPKGQGVPHHFQWRVEIDGFFFRDGSDLGFGDQHIW